MSSAGPTAHTPPSLGQTMTTFSTFSISPHSPSPAPLQRSRSAAAVVITLGPESSKALPTVLAKQVCAPTDDTCIYTRDPVADVREPTSRTGLDLIREDANVVCHSRPMSTPEQQPDFLLPPFKHHQSFPPAQSASSFDHHTAHHTHRSFYTSTTSSAESFESDTIATPWRRRSSTCDTRQLPPIPSESGSQRDISMTIPHLRPSMSSGHTDGEDDTPGSMWTPRRNKKPFWSGTRLDIDTQILHPSTPPGPQKRVNISLHRSRSPDSAYTQSSSPAPRSSSDDSLNSGPSIRVTESPRGVPRLCFTEGEDALLGPPLPAFSRLHSQPNDSVTTITGKTPPASTKVTPRPFPTMPAGMSPPSPRKSASSTTSSLEPSPIARSRRLNALRRLVPSLNFDQPWSVIDRSEVEDENHFWACGTPDPVPQIDRLSLGSQFHIDDGVCRFGNESTVSLPSECAEVRSDTRRHSRRVSRSMASVAPAPRHAKSDDDSDSLPRWQERPISPPMLWSRPPSPRGFAHTSGPRAKPEHDLPPRAQSIHGSGSGTMRKASTTRVKSPLRQPPRPSRLRKESFNIPHSGYSKSLRPLTPRPINAAPTWRESLMHETIYDRVLSGPDGHLEVKRQEVIWEMCETEQVFVRACRDVLRLFANPLRLAQGQWMSGIPPNVCELFEALEVITHTHHELSTQQQGDRRSSDVMDVSTFVTQFRSWVHGLACHEPYIVLFNPVTQYVEEASRDDTSTFGEFLRMQTRDKALGSLTLGSMLLKPVQRLTKYPLFLKRLLETTPDGHPAHNEVAELLEATEAILGKLEACKAREDDFLQLSTLEEQLDGLPLGFELAVRGRRLIGHCQVVRHEADSNMSRSNSLRALRATLSSTVKSHSSETSVQTGSSGGSHSHDKMMTGSMASSIRILSPVPSRPHSRAASRAASRATSPAPARERTIHRTTSMASSLGDTFRTPSKSSLSVRKPARDTLYTMFLFNDMVAIATVVPERKGIFKTRKEVTRFRVVSSYDGGIGTVEGVREIKDWSDGHDAHDRAFTLSLRSPSHHVVVANYSLAPTISLPRRAQRTVTLGGPRLETIEQILGSLSVARSVMESDSERGESEHE